MKNYALAVWDFETLHDSIMENKFGLNWFREFPAERQPFVVEVEKMVNALNNRIGVNWHDAVADWRYFSSYAQTITRQGVRPIQVLGQGKGLERITPYTDSLFSRIPFLEGLDELVLVGVSDTLLPIISHAQAVGLKVIGIGAQNQSYRDCEMQCDEFYTYTAFLGDSDIDQSNSLSKQDTNTLIKAMHDLSLRTGSEWIQRVRIKPAMVRIDAHFDEKAIGYETFSSFLEDQQEMLSHRHHYNENEPEYRLKSKYRQIINERLSPEEKRQINQVALYARIGAEQGLRLPEPEIIWVGLDIYATFLRDDQGFASFSDLDDECFRQLLKDLPHVSLTDSKKVRQVLFKCFLFSPGDGTSIGFREDVKTLEDIEDLYFDLITARVARKAPLPINFEALSIAVTGEAASAQRLKECFDRPEEVIGA